MTSANSSVNELVKMAREQYRTGSRDAALRELRQLAENGVIAAMVELAHIARKEDEHEEADKWIDTAETTLRPDDEDGHLLLYGAYSLGLGRGQRADQQQHALHHLEEVARAGNSYAQETIALYCLHRLNGCEKNRQSFLDWIGMALASGSPRAVYIYAEHLFQTGQPIPPDIVEKLGQMSDNRAAAKLSRAIARRLKQNRSPADRLSKST